MLVSVVINNHNYRRFLAQAIDSALRQTYREVEIIVVDDGSTDGSRTLMNTYGTRIQTVFSDKRGQAAACNAGIAHSSGEIVMLLDADDLLEPDAVEHVVREFELASDVAWVQYRLMIIDADGRRTGVVKPPDYLPRRGGDLRRHILNFPFDIMRMATSGNAFAATALKQILPIPEDVYSPSGVDWYLCPLIGLFGRVVFLDVVGGAYRVHGQNAHWFERPEQTLNLVGLRRNVRLMQASAAAIEYHAHRLGLRGDGDAPGPIVSVSYMASWLTSLKLDETMGRTTARREIRLVLALALRAVACRFDVRWPMKILFIVWFLAMALAPRGLAVRLGEIFFFNSKRSALNPFLGRLHMPVTAEGAS